MSRAEPVQQQLSPQVPGNKPAMAQPGGVAQQIGEERVAPDFTSHPDADFPGVGELPVPHVSPLTAHVTLYWSRMTVVPPCYPPALLCIVRRR